MAMSTLHDWEQKKLCNLLIPAQKAEQKKVKREYTTSC